MKKKVISAILCGAMVLGTVCPVLAADDKSEDTKTEAAGNSAEGKKIALVGKAAGNAFFEIAADAFKSTVEAEGGTVETVYPETATADAQIKVLDNLISQDFDAICISANDVNALQAKLEEAMDAGIKVLSGNDAQNDSETRVYLMGIPGTALSWTRCGGNPLLWRRYHLENCFRGIRKMCEIIEGDGIWRGRSDSCIFQIGSKLCIPFTGSRKNRCFSVMQR